MQFGRLTVIEEAAQKSGRRRVLCRCECGELRTIFLKNLVRGATKSCGCLHKEINSRVHLSHGYASSRRNRKQKHPLYLVWRGIKTRCYNSRCRAYKTYGARGIRMCEPWKENPVAFIEWSLSNGWSPKLTIERINPRGHYEPSNCEFITKSENTKRRLDHERIARKNSCVLAAMALPG